MVKATQDRMVFLISSNTKSGRWYRFDALAMGGAGQCQCPNWLHQISKNIALKFPLGVPRTEGEKHPTLCKHGHELYLKLMSKSCVKMAKELESQNE